MSAPAFLDDEDLQRLTGYVMPAKQIEYLKRHGIPHRINSKGRAVVRRDESEAVESPEMGPVR